MKSPLVAVLNNPAVEASGGTWQLGRFTTRYGWGTRLGDGLGHRQEPTELYFVHNMSIYGCHLNLHQLDLTESNATDL